MSDVFRIAGYVPMTNEMIEESRALNAALQYEIQEGLLDMYDGPRYGPAFPARKPRIVTRYKGRLPGWDEW